MAVPAMSSTEKAATVPPLGGSPVNGRCLAVRLPIDQTIARAARSHASAHLTTIGLPRDDHDDVVSMVSELATNALEHGGHRDPQGQRHPEDVAELWMYQRSADQGSELVVKVFDTFRGWRTRKINGTELFEHGRGLSIVKALSAGRCGHHLTRSRQSNPPVPGKAAWFALPFPGPALSVQHPNGADTTADLRALLAARGVEALINERRPGVAELSIPPITVRCRDHQLSWTVPDGRTVHLPAGDITEACEQITQLHELMAERTRLRRRAGRPSPGGR
jgi:anti-sigma regulatory factor (Ser/Thr protein kinase)